MNVDSVLFNEEKKELDLLYLRKILKKLDHNNKYTFVDWGQFWIIYCVLLDSIGNECNVVSFEPRMDVFNVLNSRFHNFQISM